MLRRASSMIAVALDNMEDDAALRFVSQIGNRVATYKIHDFWDEHGVAAPGMLMREGAPSVWVDLKLDDTPDTITFRGGKVKKSGASYLTVHIKGGKDMLAAAIKLGIPHIIGVTELTSLYPEEIEERTGKSKDEAVALLARKAVDAGLSHIVCSPKEVGFLREQPGLHTLTFITPGIKAADTDHIGQARTDTPANAILAGSGMLVLGRILTQAKNPVDALDRILDEVDEALDKRGY